MAFRWMKIAARRIHAQRPAAPGNGLPGREPQGEFQKGGDIFDRHGPLPVISSLVEIRMSCFRVFFKERQKNAPGFRKRPEGGGLVFPVHIPQGSRKAVEVMFGPLMVQEYVPGPSLLQGLKTLRRKGVDAPLQALMRLTAIGCFTSITLRANGIQGCVPQPPRDRWRRRRFCPFFVTPFGHAERRAG